MPFIDGVFHPRRFRRHTEALFNVLPPDHPDSEATEEDRQWYDELTEAVVDLLVYIVKNVRRNYEERLGITWTRNIVYGKEMRARRIARILDDDEFTHRKVFKAVDRLAKQFGLIVYSAEPGERLNWPMPGKFLTRGEAVQIVHDAFWERWPNSIEQEGKP